MGAPYLSRRIFSLTAIAFPLTLVVPMHGTIGVDEQFQSPNKYFRSADSVENGSFNEDVLIAEDSFGEKDSSAPLVIKASTSPRYKILSIQLVCAQGGLALSDAKKSYSMDARDHVINITSWDLSNISVRRASGSEKTVHLTAVAEYNDVFSGRNRSYVKNITVQFREPVSKFDDGGVAVRDMQPTVEVTGAATVQDATYPSTGSDQLDNSPSEVFIAEAPPIAPLRPETGSAEKAISEPLTDDATTSIPELAISNREAAILPPDSKALPPDPAREVGVLVERAKGLIRRGDISGARRLLEHARTRNARDATFLLAQTYDPERLRAWNVRGLQPDPDLARSLYAMAADHERSDARLLAATDR